MDINELAEHISNYENGESSVSEVLHLFAYLIKSGLAWQLQNSAYGRTAKHYIEEGFISANGDITGLGLDIIDRSEFGQ